MQKNNSNHRGNRNKKDNQFNLTRQRHFLIISVIIAAVITFFFILDTKNNNFNHDPAMVSLVACLAEKGVLVYGSNTCPACLEFADQFGGYAVIAPIYVECSVERRRCSQEMQTNFVPEIQINGKLYEGPRTPEMLAQFVGCAI